MACLRSVTSSCSDRFAMLQGSHPLIPSCSDPRISSCGRVFVRIALLCSALLRRAWFLVSFHAALQMEKKFYPSLPSFSALRGCFRCWKMAPPHCVLRSGARLLSTSVRAEIDVIGRPAWSRADAQLRVEHQRFGLDLSLLLSRE